MAKACDVYTINYTSSFLTRAPCASRGRAALCSTPRNAKKNDLVDGATVHCTYTYSAGNPGNLRSGFGGGFGSRRSNHLLFAMMFGGGGGGGMSDY